MYESQILSTSNGYRLHILMEGKVVYESIEKRSPEAARAQAYSFVYRGPNVCGGGSGDGSGNGRRRKPKKYVVPNDKRIPEYVDTREDD